MSVAVSINHLRKTRANLLKLVDDLNLEQLNKIPEGFNNNLIWNLAHCVVTQQLLCYKLSGLPISVSNEMVALYRKGGKPEGDVNQAFVDQIKEMCISSVDKIETDYNAGLFKSYNEYTTSYGVTLSTSEQAIQFNNTHEGMHLGTMIALKKLV